MQGPGDQLFAGAALAANQHRGGVRLLQPFDFAQDLLEGLTLADKTGDAPAFGLLG